MKKLTFIPLVLALLVTACGKKEGAPEKKYRIDDITAVETQYHDNVLVSTIDAYVEEDWHWDGNEVYRIDYRSDHPYSENIYYDSRRRIVRTTIPAYNISTEFAYSDRLLDRIDCYRDDQLFATYTFIHDADDLLTEIDCHRYPLAGDSNLIVLPMRANPLTALLGTQLARPLMARAGRSGAKSASETRYCLTWTDDNVTAIQCIEGDTTTTVSLTYDSHSNPYNQLFNYRELNDPIYGFEMLSANNIVTLRMPYLYYGNTLFTYQYEYDGDCPAKRTLTYSYRGVSNASLDSVTVTCHKTETYKYVD